MLNEYIDEKRSYDKISKEKYLDLGTPYDYDSILHYGPRYNAINIIFETIVPLKYPYHIARIATLSKIDIEEIKKYYECDQPTNKPTTKKLTTITKLSVKTTATMKYTKTSTCKFNGNLY